MTKMLAEAKRLHDLGFGILLLHHKSKRPKENGWTTGDRQPWKEIKSKYIDGDNIGVRLGSASKIGNYYLACIDVDVKDPSKKELAKAALKKVIGEAKLPCVSSGAGNGSCHLYCVTAEPFKMITVAKDDGWEVCIYSTGRQMVLSPSIHPVTGNEYRWVRPITQASDLPLLGFEALESAKSAKETKPSELKADNAGFEVTPVDISWLPVSEKIRAMILTGEGVEDRSASLLPVSHALFSAGCTKNEILSLLTDPENYLGPCSYEHAKTNNRERAAAWLWKYTVAKVFAERAASTLFSTPINDSPNELSFDQIYEAEKSLEEEAHWTSQLDITKDDKYKATLRNVVIILQNAVGADFVRRDLFSYRDFYSFDTAWGGKKDKVIIDDDLKQIKLWLSNYYGIEPNTNLLGEAITVLAIENSFDPLVEWLNELPEWDEVPRIDTWLKDHFGAVGHEDYLAQVFRKWLLGMVMRAFEPGCKFDWMPIFEGAQGVGKSSFGRLLCGEKFFLDWLPDLNNKDSALALQGTWSVEMGELASFRKNEIEAVKAFLTRKVDKVRPPYGMRWLEVPRRCVFFGTTNYETYLRDDSGNRRFKPVKVGQLNFEQLEKDRDQLFAEAIYIYKYGFETLSQLDIVGEAKDYEQRIQSEKMVQDDSALMGEILREFLDAEKQKKEDERRVNLSKFSLHELFAQQGIGPLKNWKFDSRTSQFAAKALKMLGAQKTKIMGNNYWKL